MNKVKLIRIISVLITVFTGIHCKKEPPIVPPDTPLYKSSIIITAEEVGLSEVWLKVKFLDTLQPRVIQMVRNSVPLFNFTLSAQETVLVDSYVLPQRDYYYSAYRIDNNKIQDSSNTIQIRTKDTTSHNFDWTLGSIGFQASIIRDVAIINDSLVYAVGKFYGVDSSIGSQIPYNVARWNGKRWDLLMVWIKTFNVPPTPASYWPSEIYGIYAASPEKIFLTKGVTVTIWDGKKDSGSSSFQLKNAVGPIWGNGENNVIAGGYNGSVNVFNGIEWSIQNDSADCEVTDIFGTENGNVVWVVGYNTDGRGFVLNNNDGLWRRIYRFNEPGNPIKGYISTVWVNSDYVLMGGSQKILFKYSTKENLFKNENIPFRNTFTYSIRGSNINNVFMACESGNLYHWNGASWHHFTENTSTNRSFYKIAVTSKLVVAVGIQLDQLNTVGLTLIGKK